MQDQYKNDSKEIKKLLKKLQETFLDAESTSEKDADDDKDDRKFREQLAKMLHLSPTLQNSQKKTPPKQEAVDEQPPLAKAANLDKPAPKKKAVSKKAKPASVSIKQNHPVILEEPEVTEDGADVEAHKMIEEIEIIEQPEMIGEPETIEKCKAVEDTESIAETAPTPLENPLELVVPIPSEIDTVAESDTIQIPESIEEKDMIENFEIVEAPEHIKEVESIEEAPLPLFENPLNLLIPIPSDIDTDTESDNIEKTEIGEENDVIEKFESVEKHKIVKKSDPIEEGFPTDLPECSNVTVFIPDRHEPFVMEASEQLALPIDELLQSSAEQPIVIRPTSLSQKPVKSSHTVKGGIVVRPQAEPVSQSEKILISPGQIRRVPIPKQSLRRQLADNPIKIGKEILPADQRKEIPDPAAKPKPIMKKEQNVTLVTQKDTPEVAQKSTTRVIVKGPATPSKKPPVTMPRSSGKNDTGDGGGSEPPRKVQTSKATSKRSNVSLPRAGGRRVTAHAQHATADEMLNPPLPHVDDADEMLEELTIEEIPLDAPEEASSDQTKISITQRRTWEKRRREEEALSPLELIRKRNGLNEDDVVMMLDLGYENELGRLIGFDNLKRIKSEQLKTVGKQESKHYRTAFGYRGEEFADAAQRDAIRAAYKHDRKLLILRIVLTALITLLLLLLSFPAQLGITLPVQLLSIPILHPASCLVLLMGAAALSWRQLRAGARSFFKFAPTPYTIPAVLLPFVLLYDLASFFTSTTMLQVDFAAACVLLLTALCDALRLGNEMRTFRILSADEPKIVLDAATPRKRKLRRGNKIVRIVNDDLGDRLYRVRPADQCVGFFRRSNDMHSAARPFTAALILLFALAFPAAVAIAVRTDSLSVTLSASMAILLSASPIFAIFAYFYPLYRANRLLCKHDCALIGEESVSEYSQQKTLIFEDNDLYVAQRQAEISLEGGDVLRSDLRLAGILFRKLGGSLRDIGAKLSGGQADPPVSILRVQDNGVEAMIDNSRHVLIGNGDFLRRSGIRVPRESTDRILRRSANVSLMYLAVDGLLKLGYEIEYHTDESFERLVAELADSNTSVAIRSYDPNLSDTFLHKSRIHGTDLIQVIRPGRFEEEKPVEISDTGAVALREKREIARTVYAAASIARLHRFSQRMQWIASILAVITITGLALLGRLSLVTIPVILVYHAFWIVASVTAVHAELPSDKMKNKK